ncbi:hypothetical protein [Pseudonocardia acidicola]|uniref:DUF3093 family protein n=1 Tax=Pseudonocardia acidicola TaxID=2724939 RepID=A0ABX1SL57_9PSEU|nr:hypothetical protein [Pseudonocardia acidicola]NMI01513.1 hypothetical protein [Pseudonocardia acidicola]
MTRPQTSPPGRRWFRGRIDPYCWFAVSPLLAVAVVVLVAQNPWWVALSFAGPAVALVVFDCWANRSWPDRSVDADQPAGVRRPRPARGWTGRHPADE